MRISAIRGEGNSPWRISVIRGINARSSYAGREGTCPVFDAGPGRSVNQMCEPISSARCGRPMNDCDTLPISPSGCCQKCPLLEGDFAPPDRTYRAAFPALLIGLMLAVELGLRLRHASDFDAERQSLIESARDGLSVLLSLLLGFSLPMALPHYDLRSQLVVDEANAIGTVEQRAQMLPEPFRGKILQSLREYVDVRIEFVSAGSDVPRMLSAVNHAKNLQNQMWQEAVLLVQEKPNAVTPIFAQSLGELSDLIERRLAAAEKRIPGPIWMILIFISLLTCLVVGFSLRHRFLLAMLVVPLTVTIVLTLVSELDNSRTGVVRVSQQSMLRLQAELRAEVVSGGTSNEPSGEQLENTDWRLIRLNDKPIVAPSLQHEPNLLFDGKSRHVSGSGGCNQVTGSYELHGDQLTFGQVASTRMACPQGMDTEAAFLEALTKVKKWKIVGRDLELFDAAGKSVALFEARQ
jgi:heat shock protein HslJ